MRLLNKLLNKINKNQKYRKSYSQCGEDLIVKFIFDNVLKISKPSYIDVGANHPYKINNTYLFYKNGSTGINVEPNLTLWRKLIKFRKNDINLNIGVSDKMGYLDFYMISPNTMSTFSKVEAEMVQREHNFKIEAVTKIKVETVQNIIHKHFNNIFPDLLSLDVEGLDEQILNSIDFINNGPKIIIVETIEFSNIFNENLKRKPISDLLLCNGYLCYADTMINTIFVKKTSLT